MRLSPLLVLIAGSLLATSASAQRPNTRQGFWLSGGLGPGSAGVDCSGCTNDRTTGLSGNLRLGGTLGGGKFLLGGETNGWVHSESGVDETIGFLSFIFVWYPSNTGAFFFKLGAGGMRYSANDGVDELSATAPSGSVGIGYDFRVGRNVSLTPYLNALATSGVDAKFNGQSIATPVSIKINLVQLGLAVTMH